MLKKILRMMLMMILGFKVFLFLMLGLIGILMIKNRVSMVLVKVK